MDIQGQTDFIKLDLSDAESEIEEEKASFLSLDTLTPLPIPPWVTPKRQYSRNFITMLDEEILDFVSYVKPTKGEIEMRKFTLKRLNDVIQSLWSSARVHCFGSFETELYLPSSDMDCVVIEPHVNPPKCLYELQERMMETGIAKRVDVIAKSKVPIIKYVDSITHIHVDVSFNILNGVETAKIVKSVLNTVIGEAARHLMLVLKQFLVQRHLNEVFTGGLGSYALFCMITSFLRIHPMICSGEINPMENIGILLIEFFELYGKNFNYYSVGIELTNTSTRYFMRGQDHNGWKPSMLSIKDPQDAKNDISTGSYNYSAIKFAFQRAFSALTSMIGAAYEHGLSNEKKRKQYVKKFDELEVDNGGYMITILGSILSLSRSVLEQRDYIELQYEKYSRGELTNEIDAKFKPPIPLESQKRKRDDDFVYVEVDSEDSSQEEENSMGKVDRKGHQNKKQRHAKNEQRYQQHHKK